MAANSADEKRPVNVSLGFARRAAKAVRAFEVDPSGSPSGGSRSTPWTPAIMRAAVTTAIPTGTMASPSSSGRITLWRKTGGTWAAAETGVTVFNDNTMPSSIPSGRAVKVSWIAGEWWLNTASCS